MDHQQRAAFVCGGEDGAQALGVLERQKEISRAGSRRPARVRSLARLISRLAAAISSSGNPARPTNRPPDARQRRGEVIVVVADRALDLANRHDVDAERARERHELGRDAGRIHPREAGRRVDIARQP